MRAVRLHVKDRRLEVEDVPRPRLSAGQVLVEVRAAGVCGTELHFLDGLLTPAMSPITLGHEVAGVVAEVADGVRDVSVGQEVAVHYFHACGRCSRCRRGDDHLCDSPLGALAFATDGAFAEFVAVPVSSVVLIPEGLSMVDAAPLCCSGATALHAVDIARLQRGDTAVVYGVGGVGLALVQVLKLGGVRVIAVARSRARLALAEELGADVTLSPMDGDVGEAILEATAGVGADAVFELVGTAESGRNAIGSLAKGGAVVYIGYSFDRIEIHPLSLVVPEHRILTSVGNRRSELVRALEMGAAGQLRSVVTTAPLDQAPALLEELRHGRVEGRVVLVP